MHLRFLFFQLREGFLACDFYNYRIKMKEYSECRREEWEVCPSKRNSGSRKWGWHWASAVDAALDCLPVADLGIFSWAHLDSWRNSVEPGWEINRKVWVREESKHRLSARGPAQPCLGKSPCAWLYLTPNTGSWEKQATQRAGVPGVGNVLQHSVAEEHRHDSTRPQELQIGDWAVTVCKAAVGAICKPWVPFGISTLTFYIHRILRSLQSPVDPVFS